MLGSKKRSKWGKLRDRQRRQFVRRGPINMPHAKRKTQIRHRLEELQAEGWGQVWDDEALEAVARAETTYAKRFDRGTDVTNAEILEVLVNWGITKLAWLGNFATEDEQGNISKPFLAHAESAREFDDKRHRIDTVVTLKVSDETRKKYPELESSQVELGLDVTTWKKDTRISESLALEEELEYFAEKISRSNNERPENQRPAPFGFSQIDFYLDPWETDEYGKRERERKELVPRFVIGVQGKIADAIMRDDFVFDKRWERIDPKGREVIENDVKTAMVGLKVMSEIRAQAEMLLQMMPEDEECTVLRAKVSVIRDKMTTGLKRNVGKVAKLMNTKGVLPHDIAERMDGVDYEEAIRLMEEMFRDENRGESGENRSLKESLKGARRAEAIYDPTYAGIMRVVENLLECAASPKSEGLKKLQPRDKAVIWRHGEVQPLEFE